MVYGLKLRYILFFFFCKMAIEKKGAEDGSCREFKANWGGFISQDFSKPNNEFRSEVFEQIKEVKHPSWREFMGDVLLYLFENATAEEVLDLLTK